MKTKDVAILGGIGLAAFLLSRKDGVADLIPGTNITIGGDSPSQSPSDIGDIFEGIGGMLKDIIPAIGGGGGGDGFPDIGLPDIGLPDIGLPDGGGNGNWNLDLDPFPEKIDIELPFAETDVGVKWPWQGHTWETILAGVLPWFESPAEREAREEHEAEVAAKRILLYPEKEGDFSPKPALFPAIEDMLKIVATKEWMTRYFGTEVNPATPTVTIRDLDPREANFFKLTPDGKTVLDLEWVKIYNEANPVGEDRIDTSGLEFDPELFKDME